MAMTFKWAPKTPSILMRTGRTFLAAAGILALSALIGMSQSTTAPSTPPRSPTLLAPEANRPPDANAQMLMRQSKLKQQNFDAANAERLRELTKASRMLETFAVALEAEIEKDKTDQVSPSEMQKAENIEKLAHMVKERMKLTIGPN